MTVALTIVGLVMLAVLCLAAACFLLSQCTSIISFIILNDVIGACLQGAGYCCLAIAQAVGEAMS